MMAFLRAKLVKVWYNKIYTMLWFSCVLEHSRIYDNTTWYCHIKTVKSTCATVSMRNILIFSAAQSNKLS